MIDLPPAQVVVRCEEINVSGSFFRNKRTHFPFAPILLHRVLIDLAFGSCSEVPFVPEEVLERQAHPWSLPLPSPVQDLLEDRQGHGCSQDRPRC